MAICPCGTELCTGKRVLCIQQAHANQAKWWGSAVRQTTTQPDPANPWNGPVKHTCCSTSSCSCASILKWDYHWWPPGTPIPPELEEEDPIEIKIHDDGPAVTYTIDLPGFQDFLRIPALESPKLRKERNIRFGTKKSPIPNPIAWIPSVINILDDAEDLLITLLVIGKPIFRRLPYFFMPGLGWILTLDVALNLANLLLATALASRSWKRATMKSMLWMFVNRKARLRAVNTFLNKTLWTSFFLQAGQVSTQYTGYGLSLGAVMGLITDSVWGVIKLAQGEKVIVRPPPRNDILSKAARVLAEMPQAIWFGDNFSMEEQYTLITAQNLAAQIVMEYTPPSYIGARASELGEMSYPVFAPSRTDTLWSLQEQKIIHTGLTMNELTQAANDGDQTIWETMPDDAWDYTRSYVPFDDPYPPISEVLRITELEVPNYQLKMDNLFGKTSSGTVAGWLHNVHARENLNWANSTAPIPPLGGRPYQRKMGTLQSLDEPLENIFEEFEIDIGHAIEYSVFPPGNPPDWEILQWLQNARALSNARGWNHAGYEDLQQAAIEIWGGYNHRPYQTFPE